MSIRPLIVIAALCAASLGIAQFPGTSPVVTRKAADKRVVGPVSRPISTHSFSPQIKEVTGLVHRGEVENRFNHLVYETTEQNTITLGGMLPTPSPLAISKQFPGIGFDGWYPPDPDVAVGPNSIVSVVNVAIAFFTKNGTKLFEQDLGGDGFFSGMDVTTFVFDPKCFYDTLSNRFFVVALEKANTPTTSKLLVAVSDDADPQGTWHRYRIESKQTVNTVDYWLDYPGFGYNKDAVLITGNMFGFTNGYNGVQYIVLPKAALLTGAAPTISYFSLPGDSVQVMRTPDAALDAVVGVNWTGLTTAMIHAVTDILTTPVLSTVAVAIPSFNRPAQDAVSTGGRQLDSLDGRMLNCQVRNGRLYTAHTVRFSNLDATNGSRWYEFNLNNWPVSATNPTLRQAGTIGIGSGIHYWMPAIGVNSAGDIAVVFSRASSSITADFMAASRRASDPLGFMNTPKLLAKSVGGTYGEPGFNRWGDYFGCQVDPVDGLTFWGIGMIANAGGDWQTVINSFRTTTPFSGGPASIVKFEGGTASGVLGNIVSSDNLYYKINSVSVDRTGQVSSAIATFNITATNIATLNFTMETGAATYVTASMFIWDWSTSKWVYVGATPQTTADKVWSLGVGAPFSRYINASKQAKILVRSIMPFSTVRPAVPYTFKIDQLKFNGTN